MLSPSRVSYGALLQEFHNQSKVDVRLASLGAAPTSAPPAAPPEPALVDYLEDGFKTMVYPDDPGVSRADWFR